MKGVPDVVPFKALLIRNPTRCHYRVQEIGLFSRSEELVVSGVLQARKYYPYRTNPGHSDLPSRSRPMFHSQLRNVPTGTWGFLRSCSTATYEMFQVEHDGFRVSDGTREVP